MPEAEQFLKQGADKSRLPFLVVNKFIHKYVDIVHKCYETLVCIVRKFHKENPYFLWIMWINLWTI